VLDLSIWRPGPYATQLLAEIGADVLKVEPPGGDPMRSYPALFASLHANKRSIVLDLKQPAGQARACRLAAAADVLVEGFRPGVIARLGLSYDAVRSVNPSIVYCSISGMGQEGSLAFVSGHDLNYQAWAGALAPDAGTPVVSPVPIADLAGGMAAAFAVVAALYRRLQTGEGERIDVAMGDVLATWTGAARAHAQGVDPSVRGVPGYGLFETADGTYVALGVLTEDHFWRGLCEVLGLEREVADLGFTDRMARLSELQERIATAIRSRSRAELVDRLLAASVPIAPVLDRDGMLGHEHFRARDVVTTDPWADPASGYPVRFTAHPARRHTPPPGLDADRDADIW
jgi:crotonobetainyl-CoA:carnitine CoA-transferase CaiB-like acyl-CoA transferase